MLAKEGEGLIYKTGSGFSAHRASREKRNINPGGIVNPCDRWADVDMAAPHTAAAPT